MLTLKKVVKNYQLYDEKVEALRGIDLSFRKSEFVSILGPSGCGKTTLLNIIGGLDRYTSGDIIISGRSTKDFKDSDWDAYRNHSIGFVFQNYNLIPHQSVLANVELALTLSGVSKSERRKRAAAALEKVGLRDQMKKRPNQMSGGQMQRVAIARALVNDPEILLADEPTGALDSQTSVQIMDILREVSKDRLVIMVTHNRELAEEYSSRIVTLLDGSVKNDTNPYSGDESDAPPAGKKEKKAKKNKLRAMSIGTAFSLSFNNLMTKRARTFLTSFAGSIGIIGIALILALSTGVQAYIDTVQKDTLSSYPIQIMHEDDGMGAIMQALASSAERTAEGGDHGLDAVYSNPQMYTIFNALFVQEKRQNDLASFKNWLESNEELRGLVDSIQYGYNIRINAYVLNTEGKYVPCDITGAMTDANGNSMFGSASNQVAMINLWEQILPSSDGALVSDSYKDSHELIYGSWPENEGEIVLILDKNNELSDMAFYSLGIIPQKEVTDVIGAAINGRPIEAKDRVLQYEDVLNTKFKVLSPAELYADTNSDGIFESITDDETRLEMAIRSGLELRISGIVRTSDGSSSTNFGATFGYTSALTEYLINKSNSSPVSIAQRDDKNVDVLTGLPFEMPDEAELSDEEKADEVYEFLSSLRDPEKVEQYMKILSMPAQEAIDSALNAFKAQNDSREKLESYIADAYSIDNEQIHEYLSDYTDEELSALIEEQIISMLKTQAAEAAEDHIKSLMESPDEEDLQMIVGSITSKLSDKMSKIGFIAADWSKSTSMPMDTIMGYLFPLDDETINNYVYGIAMKMAPDYYNGAMLSADAKQAKAAAEFNKVLELADQATLLTWYDICMPSSLSNSNYEANLIRLGALDLDVPNTISIYARTFEDKDAIADLIAAYNDSVDSDSRINYTDYVAMLMSGITNIINAISYGLITFVSISLVVSSIMIGIITYISVLERTKEIGILRSIGASKRDVSCVFNAETGIIGLASGLLGVGISLLLCIPISAIVHALSGVYDLNAFIRPEHCVILVLISFILTLISGLIPARIASKKDPVEALRSE